MQQVIVDRVEKTREQLKTFKDRSLDELQQRRSALLERATDVRKNGEDAVRTARKNGEDAVRTARKNGEDAVHTAQVSVLETARDVLSWATERVEWTPLSRGEKALGERLVEMRSANAATLPIDGYDELSVKKVVAALDAGSFNAETLQVIRAYEVANKNRVTLLREMDTRLTPADVAQSA